MRRTRASREVIAFQGERGAFSEEAARRLLGATGIEVLPCPRFEDVFRSLQEGEVNRRGNSY